MVRCKNLMILFIALLMILFIAACSNNEKLRTVITINKGKRKNKTTEMYRQKKM
ncbi:hypothetical protein CV093_17160 [Oceanobacillus sp. 143]|nr:hypothetical protein CV093_17160 [Oceanobacillus sp. 143]